VKPAALVAAVVLATAACGGSHRQALGAGARAVPPNTVVFFAARTDAPHWQELARATLRFVPQVANGADEVDVAILQGGRRVVVTNAAARSGPSLADSPQYRDLLRTLPGNAPGYAYVRGDLAGRRLLALPGQVGTAVANFRVRFRVVKHPLTSPTNAYLRWLWGGMWLTKAGLDARLRSAGPPLAKSNRVRSVQLLAKPWAPTLLDEIPADVQTLVDVVVPGGMFELLQHVPARIARRFPHAGLDLAGALDAIVLGETAVYTRAGGEVTVVSSPADAAAAEQGLRALGVTLPHAFLGGELVVSTRRAGVEAFRNGAAKLSADASFRHAGFPAQVTGLLYERGKLAAWSLPEGPDATFAVRFSG
jgi:hypothetical protein